jgi:uncharacterized membrane protein
MTELTRVQRTGPGQQPDSNQDLMPKTVIAGVAETAVVFLALNAFQLGIVSRGLYQREIGSAAYCQAMSFGAAAVFHLLYVVGFVYFA